MEKPGKGVIHCGAIAQRGMGMGIDGTQLTQGLDPHQTVVGIPCWIVESSGWPYYAWAHCWVCLESSQRWSEGTRAVMLTRGLWMIVVLNRACHNYCCV